MAFPRAGRNRIRQQSWGFQLTDLWLNTLNVALVFAFLKMATFDSVKVLVVAVLFALHPANVETVAWIHDLK